MTSRETRSFEWGCLFFTVSLAETKECRDAQDIFGEGNQPNWAEKQGVCIGVSGNKGYEFWSHMVKGKGHSDIFNRI